MQETIKGRVWVLVNGKGEFIDNIDTDMIFHNRYLHITEISQMGQYTLDNLPTWENFPELCKPGDIVVAGGNFGCGSSRQGAVDCFRALGVAALVARSYGAIYFRNAVNTGWPVLACPGLGAGDLKSGDQVEIDLAKGTWKGLSGAAQLPELGRISNVQRDIMAAGGLFELRG